MGALYALMGLIFGAIFALMAMAGVAMHGPDGAPAEVPGAIFGVGAIILFPIIYGIGGFIGRLIMGALYNLVAGMVSGIQLNFDSGPQSGEYM